MTIASVAADDPVEAATANQLIDNVNSSPGRAVFTANGLWSVPTGVHKFKVTLCGGGSAGNPDTTGGGGEDSYVIPGLPGNDSQMISALYAGVEVGTSYAITIGAGATAYTSDAGGTTSVGSILSSTGASLASKGTATVTGGTNALYMDHFALNSAGHPYGGGGAGGGAAGYQGIVIIEW